jgi:hypothetical protein
VAAQVQRRIASSSQQRVGPALPISPPVGADGEQLQPDVAFDGTNFLVVWTSKLLSQFGGSTIAATRVTPAGQVLDPNGIVIPGAEGRVLEEPTVAFGNGGYLVAYESRSNFNNGSLIFGLRIGTDGIVQGSPFQVSDGLSGIPGSNGHLEMSPSLASDGSMFLAVWHEYDTTAGPINIHDNIVGTRISGTTVLDPAGRFISQAANAQTAPDVASDGNGYLVTWADRRSSEQPDIYGARVDSAGTVLDPSGLAIGAATGTQDGPAVTFGGTRYLVAWGDDRSSGFDIRASRVTPAGAVVDPTPLTISNGTGDQTAPALGFNGTDFVAAWQDGRSGDGLDIYGTRVRQDGTVREPAGVAVSTEELDQELPAIAAGPGVAFAAWGDDRLAGDLWGGRMGADGTVLDPDGVLVSLGTRPLRQPDSAFNGTVTLVTWGDPQNGVWATRVRPDGTVLDPGGIAVRAPSYLWTSSPTVTTDGENFLVVYSHDDLELCWSWAALVSGSTGEVLSTEELGELCERPGMAFDGTNFVVTSQGWGPATDLRAHVVSRSGAPIDNVALTTDQADSYHSDAAGIDGAVLVAWRNGAVLRSDTGAVTDIALPPAFTEGATAVASDGSGFLLTRMTAGGLLSTRIDADGTVLDPAGIPVSGTGGPPSVAFNGTWLIVWNDRRTTGAGPGVYGARIEPTGAVLHPNGFVIAAGTDTDPAVSPRADGRGWTVAYPAFDGTTRAHRMYVRLVAPK